MMRHAFLLSVVLLQLCACRSQPEELIDLGPLPDWQFRDQDGQVIGSATLHGRPYLANFLFTSCPTSCPPLAKATAQLQDKLKVWLPKSGLPPVQIVSISVDPETDTPEVLREFGKKYGADARVWKFATTDDPEQMERLVTQGFLMPVIRADRLPDGTLPKAKPTPLDTAHSLRFVLVGPDGHIRGLYDRDEAGLDKADRAAHWFVDHAM
jgi:cytochrome oxidase Cu insertion factor (SCO1/SenC/PrrC family)